MGFTVIRVKREKKLNKIDKVHETNSFFLNISAIA